MGAPWQWREQELLLEQSCTESSQVTFIYIALLSVKALNSIKLEDRVSVMYNNKIKHSIFS